MQNQIILSPLTPTELGALVRSEMEQVLQNWTPPPPDFGANIPDLPTRKQTSEILQVSLVTLNEWSKSGVLPTSKVGSRVRYKKSDVLSALKDVRNLKYKRAARNGNQ
jgi:hypothetical protein